MEIYFIIINQTDLKPCEEARNNFFLICNCSNDYLPIYRKILAIMLSRDNVKALTQGKKKTPWFQPLFWRRSHLGLLDWQVVEVGNVHFTLSQLVTFCNFWQSFTVLPSKSKAEQSTIYSTQRNSRHLKGHSEPSLISAEEPLLMKCGVCNFQTLHTTS